MSESVRLIRMLGPIRIGCTLMSRLKTGGRLIRHARYFTLQLAESYVTGSLFRQILPRVEQSGPPYVIFIGGIGTIAGPIAGTLVFFLLREPLAAYGTWYMIVIGLVAVVTMIACPQDYGPMWRRFGHRFFPSSAAFATEVRSPHGICAS